METATGKQPIGQRLKELRKGRGMTQQMAALRIGTTDKTICKHERGICGVGRHWVPAYMRAYGCRESAILKGTDLE